MKFDTPEAMELVCANCQKYVLELDEDGLCSDCALILEGWK